MRSRKPVDPQNGGAWEDLPNAIHSEGSRVLPQRVLTLFTFTAWEKLGDKLEIYAPKPTYTKENIVTMPERKYTLR